MREKIAVLVAQVDETTQNRFLSEFMREAYANDCDLYIFSMYQKYQETWLRDIGDSNIFELVDFAQFNAVLIMIDTILTPGLEEPLQKRIQDEFSGPVLVVDKASQFFPSVMMDHYTPFRKLVEHLVEFHGYREIAFLGGKEGHPHSVQRLNAYLDTMRANDIKIREDWIYHGNYWYDSAEEFVDRLLQNREQLPRAIACANDCMAIGAAARLTENGVRVPEDVAIIGYDSIPEGKNSPRPLTSADIPADECGSYCFTWLFSKMRGDKVPDFKPVAPLFMGSSCGCEDRLKMIPVKRRTTWRTNQSSRGVFSDFNHILEDLLSNTNIEEFMGTIQAYSYQIQPFYSFDLCFNEGYEHPEQNIAQKAIRKGYTKKMYHVLGIGDGRKTIPDIALNRSFDRSLLVPPVEENRDYPTTYIFNPFYFDDRCFGYTVLNHGRKIQLYDISYRVWMKSVMQGMEAFYRQQYMQSLVEQIQSDQIRDSLTGLYNYEGFVVQTTRLMEPSDETTDRTAKPSDGKADRTAKPPNEPTDRTTEVIKEKHRCLHILAVDMKGLKTINEMYGRQCGDHCLKSIARFLAENLHDDEVGARMCNDEFLVAFMDTEEDARAKQITQGLRERLQANPVTTDSEYVLDFYDACVWEKESEQCSLDDLVNRAINVKNHKKRKLSHLSINSDNVENEIRLNQLVERILNHNQLTYHYQPIINATDGSIYAYEALMRHVDGLISPFQIIQSAVYLKRLDDVERATLLNVTEDVENQEEIFASRKVFINSIPGTNISEADDSVITERMRRARGRYVVEFTEENEMDDQRLGRLKKKLGKIGADIAIDDFGVGYSNVSNLLRYKPQYVKIDRQLISNIQDNPQKQHFVKSIIDFSHENHIKVLAEGVENQSELKECIYLGVDLIQGFYTARPQRNVISQIKPEIRNEIMRFHLQNKQWQSKVIPFGVAK